MQHGGAVPGHGTGDTVPAMLAPGEFVINRASAQAVGYGNLEELNMMAAGGVVRHGRYHYQDAVNPDLPWGGWAPPDGGSIGGPSVLINPPGAGVPSGPIGTPPIGIPLVPPPGLPGVPPDVSGHGIRTPGGPFFPTLGIAGPAASGGPGVWGGMAKLALHSMIMQNWAHSQGYRSSGDWMRRSGFTLPGPGSGQGPGGAGRPMTKNFQSGGMVSGGGGVHIYAFTDLKALTRHMGSKAGQKIIFDTVKGRRIDLGMK
jgi:hypothetical protein